jgi:4-amino-4-deoxy-L-arabinose transferase-like glycosyltransferase
MVIGISIVIYFLSLRVFKSTEVAIMSLILTLTMVTFYSKAIEVRPEVPQTLLGLLSIYYLFVFYDKRSLASLIASALLLAVSFLFLQKALILCFILAVLLVYDLYKKQIGFRHVFLYMIIFIICISPYYIYHLVNGSIREYFMTNWIFNIKSAQEFSKWRYIILTIRENIITCTLYL